MLFSSVFSIFALVASVNAHGYVATITCNGKSYKGGVPGETNPKSPIRSISTINPYKDPKGSGQTCGAGAKAGALIAPITAGSTLSLEWVAHPNQKWPHEMGPLITYMAKVPAGKTAATVDPSTLDFFKIQQDGLDPKNKGKWIVAQQMKLGTKYNVQVPKALENGDYIMRHEIIALHLANSKGGAEFYASCFQLTVSGGTGSAKTKPSPTVRHPGAYSATDPGIFAPKIFDPGFKYTFPGPAIAKFSNSGSVVAVNVNQTTPIATSTSAAATGKPTGKHCKRHWSSRHPIIDVPRS